MNKKYCVEDYNEHYNAYEFVGMFDTLEEAEACLERLQEGIIYIIGEEEDEKEK